MRRTKDHGMNIGMRKMIMIPQVVSQLTINRDQAQIMVTIYNASRQGLRISTKTNIARLSISTAKFDLQTKGHSTDSVTVEGYEVTTIPTRLYDMVPAESSVLVEEQNLEEDLVIIPGLLKVRTREDKQYVSVQVSNKSNSKKTIRIGTEVGAFRGLVDNTA